MRLSYDIGTKEIGQVKATDKCQVAVLPARFVAPAFNALVFAF